MFGWFGFCDWCLLFSFGRGVGAFVCLLFVFVFDYKFGGYLVIG